MLKRVATAVVLIPIVMVLVLRAPVPVLAVFAAAVALVTVQEFLKLTESYGVQPLRLPTYIFVGLIFLLLAMTAAGETPQISALKFVLGLGFACGLAPFVFLTIAMRRAQMSGAYPAAAAAAFAFMYVAVPMAMLVQLRQQWAGAFWLLYLLLVVWAGDIFAYFVGRSVGRHLMAPRISPKKTWEGAAASLAASLLVGSLLFTYALQISSFLLRLRLIERRDGLFGPERPELWPIVLLTIMLNIAAQLGDLQPELLDLQCLVLHRELRHLQLALAGQCESAQRDHIGGQFGRGERHAQTISGYVLIKHSRIRIGALSDKHWSNRRLRCYCAAPVHRLRQHSQLRRRQCHRAIDDRRPNEPSFLQTLGEKTQTRAVPGQNLHLY